MSGSAMIPDDLPDDPDAALAAEYVLRLLDAAETAACEARLARDPAFAAEVVRWQEDLAALDDAFAPAEPPARLGARVEEALFGRPPGLLARLWGSAGLWRAVAAAAVIAAVVLGRPAPETEAPELVATVAPTVGDLQLVALLDRDAGLIRFTRLAGEAPQGRSFELWLLPEGATAPESLGIIPAEARFSVPIPASFAADVGPGTQILVSNEVEGGSPTGVPSLPPVAGGAVSEL
jgi:anti-sigma-K factor RskA